MEEKFSRSDIKALLKPVYLSFYLIIIGSDLSIFIEKKLEEAKKDNIHGLDHLRSNLPETLNLIRSFLLLNKSFDIFIGWFGTDLMTFSTLTEDYFSELIDKAKMGDEESIGKLINLFKGSIKMYLPNEIISNSDQELNQLKDGNIKDSIGYIIEYTFSLIK